MPLRFPQAFPLLRNTEGQLVPAVRWGSPENCRPSDTFGPDETYGLPTGERNGFWAVDLDRKNGKDGVRALSAACEEHGGLPDTYTVRTSSGGVHLYFAWDPVHTVRNRAGVLEGVDVRGLGGFVRAGGVYKVIRDLPIAPAPDWLYELLGANSAGPDAPAATSAHAIGPDHPEWSARLEMASAFLASEPPCISGQGGQAQLWKVALRIMRTYELPVATARELLAPYNRRCVPPWSEGELTRHLVRAAEEGEGITGTFAAGSPLLGPPRPKVPTLAEAGDWKRKKDPNHVYVGAVADVLFGAVAKGVKQSPQEMAMKFTGPGAEPLWCGVWQYDIFRRRIVAINPPFKLDAETTGFTKADMARIQATMSAGGMIAGMEAIENAVMVAARECEFHPVRDYLAGLEGRMTFQEADAYFKGIAGRLWGATERDELESGHLRRFAIAAVRRIREPGTKVDSMLVLAGEQGIRKSGLCAKLAGEFFLDQMPNLEKDKEASIAIEGYWIVEFGEFRALKASEATKKEFITRCKDKYRPVWESQIQEYPRQCVFVATTNEDDFLTDPTGDTRYDVCDVRETIRLAELNRDAFWAAACVLEAAGEPHWRDRAVRARAAEDPVAESAGFHAEDPWTSAVMKYAATKSGTADPYVTAEDALTYGVVIETARQDDKMLKRVKSILRRHLGTAKVCWLDGRSRRVYRVPAPKLVETGV